MNAHVLQWHLWCYIGCEGSIVLSYCSATCPLVARYARVAHDASTGMCRPIYEDGCQTVLWSKWHQWIITIMVNTSKSVLFCMKNVLHEEDCPPVGNPEVGNPDIHRGLKMMKMIPLEVRPIDPACEILSFGWQNRSLVDPLWSQSYYYSRLYAEEDDVPRPIHPSCEILSLGWQTFYTLQTDHCCTPSLLRVILDGHNHTHS